MSALPSTACNLNQAIQQLRERGLERPDAHGLVLHALGRPLADRAWLLAHGEDALPVAAQAALQSAITRRLSGEPLAYISGSKAFYGLDLAVDARVLDPRPDTETLVDWALACMDGEGGTVASLPDTDALAPSVMDLGTGSGAIALALKHQRPGWQVHALDASPDALAVAQANAERLGLAVQWHHGNWLEGVEPSFSLIVSNPPYIAEGDAHLAALTHEPLTALVSGADGLDALRCIVRQAPAHLHPGGWLLLEHGYDQAAAVCDLLLQAGFAQVQSRADLAGIARCSGGQWPGRAAPSQTPLPPTESKHG